MSSRPQWLKRILGQPGSNTGFTISKALKWLAITLVAGLAIYALVLCFRGVDKLGQSFLEQLEASDGVSSLNTEGMAAGQLAQAKNIYENKVAETECKSRQAMIRANQEVNQAILAGRSGSAWRLGEKRTSEFERSIIHDSHDAMVQDVHQGWRGNHTTNEHGGFVAGFRSTAITE